MKYLFINTSTQNTTVAIVVNDQIEFKYENSDPKDLAACLLKIIDDGFKKTGFKPKDIDTVFVTDGPGSFTGIRIGLTVAKIMAWGLKIKIIPISSLEFLASGIEGKKYIAPLIDARRNYIYAGVYDSELNSVIDDAYVLLDDFKKKQNDDDTTYVSFDVFDFSVSSPICDILKVINKHKDDDGINPHQLNPNYLKKTEAEEKHAEGGC